MSNGYVVVATSGRKGFTVLHDLRDATGAAQAPAVWLSEFDPYDGLPVNAVRPFTETPAPAPRKPDGHCWNCCALLVENACPTKGCRGPGSGFERLNVFPDAPCVKCLEMTSHRVVTVIRGSGTRSVFATVYTPACPACQPLR